MRSWHTRNCFNTQPPEGGWLTQNWISKSKCVSTHSRPKAAGLICISCKPVSLFQHTAARRRLVVEDWENIKSGLFQHTAARRRLASRRRNPQGFIFVSTHSRPKAAGTTRQPMNAKNAAFQHTAARRRLEINGLSSVQELMFQHTAARRRLARFLIPFSSV